MNNIVKLNKFSGLYFEQFFDFMRQPSLICFGDKIRNSNKGLVISNLDVCFFTNYIESSNKITNLYFLENIL